MKYLALLPVLLVSCASTKFYRDGKMVANFQGDLKVSHFTCLSDGSFAWDVQDVNHSAATKAQGDAASAKMTAAGAAVAAGVAAITVL